MALPASRLAVRRVATRFGRIAWRSDGEGIPILLCQRFRGTIDDWDPLFVEALIARGHRVIRFDNLGIGRSDGETPSSIPAWADVALAFMTALGFERINVLGWSIGGMVAQWMALKAPSRILRLVVAASGPGGVTEAASDPQVARIRSCGTATADDLLHRFYAHTDAGRAAGQASLARVAEQSDGPPVREASYRSQVDASTRFDVGNDAIRPRLDELRMPVLVASGIEDVIQPAFASFVIAQGAPRAKLVLYPEAGHAFLFQLAEEFAREVDRFLRADA